MSAFMAFLHNPPALDPILVPFFTKFINGNIIWLGMLWVILKYVAKMTPWAGDDKIIQIITGLFSQLKREKKKLIPEEKVT